MHSFRDTEGRQWAVEIHVAAVRRVKGLVAVDLVTLVEDGCRPLGELVADPCRLVDVLWCLVQPQAQAAGVTDEDFGRALAGDCLHAAGEAFLEALVDFFPDWRARTALRQVLTRGREVQAHLLERTEQELARIDPKAMADELTRRWTPRASGASSGSSPAG